MLRAIARGAAGRIVAEVLALLVLVAVGANGQSDAQKKYPTTAPIGEYLMNRDAEIAMARTAAPVAISRDATLLVLTRKGWETAVRGDERFCMHGRASLDEQY